ncbi:orotate phosphoribosyltransferase [Thermomonospora echinospora]|uniref:Orotate phosphoribosyltransferase n=1 Tax=Thermomonospora echinospora TaxID=1992 RepID=A0A1H6CUT9_9ACTN|nr:phosphoribosyltransferase family protein [Thermomonospora echinospora]SEG76831.1 orotate phosphoribosyltransferase [Thermomonospora echinospora]
MEDTLRSMVGVRRGHFRLESGHHGDLWLDLDSLFHRPVRLRPMVESLARRIAGHGADMVCGPLSGGAFVAQMVALELDIEFCHTERTEAPQGDGLYSARYRLPRGVSVRGRRVAVVDDVINAGSAVRSTLTALRTGQADPVAIGALLTLGTPASALAADQGIALEAVGRLDNTLWEPQDCPLCAAGEALQDLVVHDSDAG